MTDREQIVELTSKLGLLVDARDWRAVEALFCDRVDLDYTSLAGGEPQQVGPADVVGGWRESLDKLQATHHVIANHVVTLDGDEARVAANVTGTHVRPNDTGGPLWVVGGRYDLTVRRHDDGWKIAALKLAVLWATGNQQIMGAA